MDMYARTVLVIGADPGFGRALAVEPFSHDAAVHAGDRAASGHGLADGRETGAGLEAAAP